MTIKDLIKNNYVDFSHFRKGNFYYNIHWTDEPLNDNIGTLVNTYQFTVPIEDIGDATLNSRDKAILFMRWIKKALDNNELIKL